VFTLDKAANPPPVIVILEEFMAATPGDLSYLPVAIQKTLQCIWIMSQDKMALNGYTKSGIAVPIPFVTLEEWLRCAHLYESFHQIQPLAFYCPAGSPRPFHTGTWVHENGCLPNPGPQVFLQEGLDSAALIR
jgi:hypothetical protein